MLYQQHYGCTGDDFGGDHPDLSRLAEYRAIPRRLAGVRWTDRDRVPPRGFAGRDDSPREGSP